jgi:hypothetical protein
MSLTFTRKLLLLRLLLLTALGPAALQATEVWRRLLGLLLVLRLPLQHLQLRLRLLLLPLHRLRRVCC